MMRNWLINLVTFRWLFWWHVGSPWGHVKIKGHQNFCCSIWQCQNYVFHDQWSQKLGIPWFFFHTDVLSQNSKKYLNISRKRSFSIAFPNILHNRYRTNAFIETNLLGKSGKFDSLNSTFDGQKRHRYG